MKKILLIILAALSSMVAYSQKYQENGTPMDFKNGLRVGKNLRIPKDTLTSADTGSLVLLNGIVYHKYGYWYPIAAIPAPEPYLPTTVLLSPSIRSTRVYKGINPVTGDSIWTDSLHRAYEVNPWMKYYLETVVDSFGQYPLNWQLLMDAVNQNGSGINKDNRLNGNGFRDVRDSARNYKFHPKVGVYGDTSFYVGNFGKHILRYSDGTIEMSGGISGLTIGNDYATISGSDGVYLSEIKAAGTTALVRSYNPITFVSASIKTDYDSVAIAASKINLGTLPTVTDTNVYKPLVQDLATKRLSVLDRWPGGAGGGSGTVNSGTANTLTYYASSGTTVSGLAAITANRALQSNSSGLPEASSVTNTELTYLSGVSSGLQSQLNGKAATSHTHATSDITSGTLTVSRGGIGVNTITGLIKGNGTSAVSAAVAGTDYSPAINTTDHLLNLTPSTGAINMRKSITALTSATSISVDMDNGPNYSLSLAHNAAITISDEQQGDWFQLWVTQTSGGNTITIEGQSIAISPGASDVTWVGGTYNGSAWVFSTNLGLGVDWTDLTGTPTTLSGYGITDAQPLNAQLTALASGSGTGIMRRTGASTYTYGTAVGLTTEVTGTLPIGNGGTGLSALGTANQLLRVNSGATALEYFTPSYITASQVHSEPTSRVLLSTGSGGVVSDPGATIVSGVLSLGQASYAGGALKLTGDQAGSVTLKVRSSSSQDVYDLNLPLVAGATGEVMVMNGSGNLEWKNRSGGTYTPTLTGVTNVSSVSIGHISWYRVDDRVFVTGTISVTPTSATTTTTLRMTLPVSSAFDDQFDCGGTFSYANGATGGMVVGTDQTNDAASFSFIPVNNTASILGFSFSYIIK